MTAMRRFLHRTLVAFVCTRPSIGIANQTTRAMNNSAWSFVHLDSTASTQDEAKKLLLSDSIKANKDEIVAVSAQEQTAGRGTSGRDWMGLRGNVFLTIALPSDRVPTTLTLLPLQLGILVAERVDKLLKQACKSSAKVQVKWPNDVLVDNQKVAGILIEAQVIDGTTWLLVGIGVNMVAAPQVPSSGENRGRPSTAIQVHCQEQLPDETNSVFAQDLSDRLVKWLQDPTSTSQKVVRDWKSWANLGQQQVLRDTREVIVPVDLKEDGQLVVKGQDGKQRLLVAEYLY